MKWLRNRLTYANVMSSMAVFLVLGGGAAFAALDKFSVGPRQLKPKAVRTGKLAPEAVKAGKLAKNAVSTNRIRDNAVTGAKINEATLGQVPLAARATNATQAANATHAGNAGALGGLAPGAYAKAPMWALVDKSGAILRQSGGITAFDSEGVYQVVFPAPLSGRAISATRAFTNSDTGNSISVEVGVCGIELNCTGLGLANDERRALVVTTALEEGPPVSVDNASHSFWIAAH